MSRAGAAPWLAFLRRRHGARRLADPCDNHTRTVMSARDSKKASPTGKTAAQVLDGCLDEHDPAIARLGRAALRKLRQQIKHAIEMVYDNYNFLVVGFGPNERPSQAIVSLVIFSTYVSICFLHGKKLVEGKQDPLKILRGTGNQVRTVRLESAGTLDEPAVVALIKSAIARAPAPFDPNQRRMLIVKSISPKKRPRRPVAKA